MRIKRRTKRFFWRVVVSIPVIVAASLLYLYFRHPSTAAPANIRVDTSPGRIGRGKYLFTALCDCDACHSLRDFSRWGGPVVIAGRGQGAVIPLNDLPGRIVASNITPDRETGIGTWTDGEKIRAIREGVGKDGHALFPLMPYSYYRSMSDEDVQALVAYLNTLPAVRNPLPKTSVTFPTSMWIKGEPQPVTRAIPPVDPGGGEIHGEYLATLAACERCHTPDRRLPFSGGRPFSTPFGNVNSANITPDKETGIGRWNLTQFMERMKRNRQTGSESFTLMPWEAYSHLDDADLEDLFLYVKAQKSIAHRVESHPK
jgi:cytochrome c553